jgi:hypothetical protein
MKEERIYLRTLQYTGYTLLFSIRYTLCVYIAFVVHQQILHYSIHILFSEIFDDLHLILKGILSRDLCREGFLLLPFNN